MIKIRNYDRFKVAINSFQPQSRTDISGIVTDIIEDVAMRGDDALIDYAKKFDNASISSLIVSDEEFLEAFELVDKKFIGILNEAAENIKIFHEKQVRDGFVIDNKDGKIRGQKIVPIERVGLYVPCGTACYPSSVLMNAIPAKIAGCSEIVITTPPKCDGKINPYILVAAKISGVSRVIKSGGAQAIAALAIGTKSIDKVDKIVGPGNAFVAEAKRQVFGRVSIDMIAGPSEILIIADSNANPKFLAADLLSQAEHDKMSVSVLIIDSFKLANEVSKEIEKQLPKLDRSEIARASIDNNGEIIVVDSIDRAIEIANKIAPEHLELCVDNPFDYLDSVKHAGSIFLGHFCPEALGDYFSGTNHTLPTSGTARFSSPLSVDDFIKKLQFTYYTKDALRTVFDKVAYFAEKEGLGAHAQSIKVRFEDEFDE